MDVKVIVQQLHNLAVDPKNRVTIVKDQGCLPGLTLFLDNKDEKVVYLAVQTLKLLAEDPENQPIMYKDAGVVMGIKQVLENPATSADAKITAAATFRLIQPKGTHQTAKGNAIPPTTPSADSKPLSSNSGESTSKNQKKPTTASDAKPHSFFKVSSRKAKIITLHISGTNDDVVKKSVEDALVRVRGLISFTFHKDEERFIVRVVETLEISKLVTAVATTNLKAQLVTKNENGEEEVKNFEEDKEGQGNDGYLDEDHIDTTHEKEFSSKTLARLEDRKGNKQGGWFGGVGNYIAKNLYW
eukprot:CFRG6285T1